MRRTDIIKTFSGILVIVFIFFTILGSLLFDSIVAIRELDKEISKLNSQVEKLNIDAIEAEEILLREYLEDLNTAQELDQKTRQAAKKVDGCSDELLNAIRNYDGKMLQKMEARGRELDPGFDILREAKKVDRIGYEFDTLKEEYLPRYKTLVQAMIKPSKKPGIPEILSNLSEKRNSLKADMEIIKEKRSGLKLWEIEFSKNKSEIYKLIGEVDIKGAKALISESEKMISLYKKEKPQVKTELEGFERVVDKIVEKAEAYSTESKKLVSTLEVLKKGVENSAEATN